MNLRHVSLRFRAAVSVNGFAISERFLGNSPLPPLARKLYPHPLPDLAHIHMDGGTLPRGGLEIGRPHGSVAEERDVSVRIPVPKAAVSTKEVRMKQRLLLSLLLLGRFFGVCHDFLEERAQNEADVDAGIEENLIIFPFERQLMADCNDGLLLQTQDVALVLVTFLRQTMRPPSKYGSVERVLRHGLVKLPPDK
ncbi:hypothetical protein B0T25DRAFT_136827 [Lasiosphaeria hispida]|uniref:Uncharacterized protein n=1 Tax=Lasiosphaeria hispida TaxID=260671 RepID=A0AAJ0HKH1_9PEZI|nr:hypothetical protein B0T25DRAFT_136827 [Lasiosphaeria hispida]